MVIDVAAPGQRPSVSVIDDDDDVRAFMRKRLEANNFNVDEADSGEEALRRVDDSIDLVIVDLGLPGIDGFTVVRSLRERFTMPIIMVTAAGDEGDRVLGLEIGADDYVVKPFLPREFVARVHAALRRGVDTHDRPNAAVNSSRSAMSCSTRPPARRAEATRFCR